VFQVARLNRNSPCWCGSGKKYKRCCAVLPEPGPVTQTMKDATDRMMAEEGYTAEVAAQLLEIERSKKRRLYRPRVRTISAILGLMAWQGGERDA